MFGLVKKIQGKWAYWTRTIALFQWKDGLTVVPNSSYTYVEVTDPLATILVSGSFPLNDYKKRFELGHVFCGLQNQQSVLVAYGWINDSGQHFLGELNLQLILPKNTTVLYDFFTFTAFRGNGLYSYLLQCICARDRKSKLIYAFPSNTSSCKGIVKAHFKALGTLTGFTKNKYSKMIQN